MATYFPGTFSARDSAKASPAKTKARPGFRTANILKSYSNPVFRRTDTRPILPKTGKLAAAKGANVPRKYVSDSMKAGHFVPGKDRAIDFKLGS